MDSTPSMTSASAIFDAKIERIEAEQESNTEAGEAEQERIAELVEKNVITEEEGEARKRAAADRTQKKEAELEKKKQELKYKQAVWDKANQLAQAGINTAMSITQTAAQLGFPAAIPFIAIAGAMGAIQIATILATPIPKYAKGTKDHPGGLLCRRWWPSGSSVLRRQYVPHSRYAHAY